MNVIWHSGRGYWDQALLEDILPLGAQHFMGFEAAPKDGAIIVLPARHCAQQAEYLNAELGKLPWALVVLSGDEEAVFPLEALRHPRMRVWVQTPHPVRHAGYKPLPNGYPTPIRDFRGMERPKQYDWSFCGQVTHPTREACVRALRGLPNGYLLETSGFTLGLDSPSYYEIMLASKVVPCPSGPCTPDTFRVAEALELGCIPIVDECPGNRPNYPKGYWGNVMPNRPFPTVADWSELPAVMAECLRDWESLSVRCQMWWHVRKEYMKWDFKEDFHWLSQS